MDHDTEAGEGGQIASPSGRGAERMSEAEGVRLLLTLQIGLPAHQSRDQRSPS